MPKIIPVPIAVGALVKVLCGSGIIVVRVVSRDGDEYVVRDGAGLQYSVTRREIVGFARVH